MPFSALNKANARSFDHYARLVRQFLDVPTALVSLVEADRQIFPGRVGLPEPYHSTRQTPLSHSFCQFVVMDDEPLVISDSRNEPRLEGNLAITELKAISYAGWPLHDEDGNAIGSLCAIDSVPRHWAEEEVRILGDLASACSAELQQSLRQARDTDQLAQSIFTSVDVAMAFYDHDQRLVMANDLARRAVEPAGLRLDQEPYAGPNVRRADNRTPIPYEEQLIPRALRGDLEAHGMQWIGPPGNEVAVVASSQQVKHSDGTPWGTLIVAHDVTDLARSLQVKEEFVATVSHELRTPLTSIIGYLEVLHEQLEPIEQHVDSTLTRIERAARNLQHRISELLDTAERRNALQLDRTDISALACRVTRTLAEQARTGSLDLTVDDAEEQWAVVDARKVEQALENLVTNALKYTPAGGSVTLTVTGDAQTVTASVADTGVGMSETELHQAFQMFWRAAETRQQAIQGIGVGLTLVKDILDAHHGTVAIHSVPEQGTTVTLTIPRSHVSPPPTTSA